jgi:hypothetical protein
MSEVGHSAGNVLRVHDPEISPGVVGAGPARDFRCDELLILDPYDSGKEGFAGKGLDEAVNHYR